MGHPTCCWSPCVSASWLVETHIEQMPGLSNETRGIALAVCALEGALSALLSRDLEPPSIHRCEPEEQHSWRGVRAVRARHWEVSVVKGSRKRKLCDCVVLITPCCL